MLHLLCPQVWYSSVTEPNGRSGKITASVKANASSVGQTLRLSGVHVLGVAVDDNLAKQLKHQDVVRTVVTEAFAKSSDAGRKVYDAQTYDVVSSAMDEVARMDDAPPFATVSGVKLPAAWVKYSPTLGMVQILGLDLAVEAPLEVTWTLD